MLWLRPTLVQTPQGFNDRSFKISCSFGRSARFIESRFAVRNYIACAPSMQSHPLICNAICTCTSPWSHDQWLFNLKKTRHGSCQVPWWRHQMETFSASLAICVGNSLVTGEFPAQMPVTRSVDVPFDLLLNKRLSIQGWGWLFETPSCPLWRHYNAMKHPHSPEGETSYTTVCKRLYQ